MADDPRHSKTPRILLTGKDETSDKVFGFTCGADDYVTKPFHMAELRARIDRQIKRKLTTDGSMVMHSCFLFNLEFLRCFVVDDGKREDLDLTPTEFRLFLTLAKNQGNVLTRRFLEIVAWESQGAVVEKRGIDTHIAHIRKKLGRFKDVIVSVYGQGYCFKPPVPEH